jgi:hypothetical protein
VSGSSQCSTTTISDTGISLSNARFGVLGEDNIRITNIQIFPVTPVGSLNGATFNFPAGSGTWTPSAVAMDPDGGVRNGIRWLSNGTGLTPADIYSLTLTHASGNIGGAYDYYAFDDVEDLFSYFRLTSNTVPTVSQWGLAIMALLVLSAATIIIRGRRDRLAMS